MRNDRIAGITLALSAITLAIVLAIAIRPAQQAFDPGPAVAALRTDAAQLRADIAALRAIVERPAPSAGGDQLAAIAARLDGLDAAVAAIAARFSTLCTAINSSPFSPPGGAC
jgi:hypothetical protein